MMLCSLMLQRNLLPQYKFRRPVSFYQTTRHHMPENCYLHSYTCKHLIYLTIFSIRILEYFIIPIHSQNVEIITIIIIIIIIFINSKWVDTRWQWITPGIIISSQHKRDLYLLCRSTKDSKLNIYYKKYCRILSDVITTAKKGTTTIYL
jgi:hypothetical protein